MRGQPSLRSGLWSQLRREIRPNWKSRRARRLGHLTRKDLIRLLVIAVLLLLTMLLAMYLGMNYVD
jgi:hypothetical protein